ncbi:MAG TPA: DUF4097 family beta strand repeat-containing protein [Candidatus Sulfotelmatobacter sp.]
MSNSVVTPPPQMTPMPPLPPRRHRSFAGPFVLIVIGAIFLLGTMRILSVSRLWHLFANYWPVLLILWGIIKLVEHQQAQREGMRSAGIGAGGVLLVVMIIVFGLIATQIDHTNWSGWRDQIDDPDIRELFGGDNFSFNDNLAQDFPAGATLKVIDTHGTVSVHASDDNKITVVVRKRINADNQGDADKYNQETRPAITAIGGLVTVDAKAEAAGDHPVEVDLDISLPRKAPLTVSSRRGDTNVTGRDGTIDISSQHGDTSIEDIGGNVKVSQEKGSVKVQQVTGDVRVEGRVNDVSVSDVKGSVALEGEFQESVKLERIAKMVTFKSARTDMEFSRIDGTLDLDSDDLHAEEITGPLHLSTRSKNIRLSDVSGDVRLQNDNGTVELGMRNVGNVQIDNRNGDLQISLPEKAGFRIDARARDGEIQSDFEGLKVDNNDHESHASGSVGNAASHIVLNNEHDNIEIRRASATPPKPPEPPAAGKAGKSLPVPKENVEPTDN